MTTPNDILREASEYIAEHGWNQGSMYGDGGDDPDMDATPAACAMGAIERVTYNHAYYDGEDLQISARTKLAKYLRENGFAPPATAGPIKLHLIARWNDMKTTTAEDVILALKDAANE